MNKVTKNCGCQLTCKATAALEKQTCEEIKKEDKPLQELLNEKQPEDEK
jgi:hypothetical protein